MQVKNEVIGHRIKQIRVSRNETLEKFASAIQKATNNSIKTTKSNVSKWEKGLNIPNDIALKAISDIGNVSIDYLTGKSDINLTQDDIDMFNKINSLEGMELKKYIAELNSKGVTTDLDPTNEIRFEYSKEYLETAVEALNTFLKNDYYKYEKLSAFSANLLFRSLKLMNDDENNIILKNIFEALLTKRGILSDDIFKYVKTETVDGKKKKNLVDAPMDIALDNYFKTREKLNAALNNYFLSEFNKRYKD